MLSGNLIRSFDHNTIKSTRNILGNVTHDCPDGRDNIISNLLNNAEFFGNQEALEPRYYMAPWPTDYYADLVRYGLRLPTVLPPLQADGGRTTDPGDSGDVEKQDKTKAEGDQK